MKVIVTAGPTFEPIDPVRFIGNRSSGKQGYAIAKALHNAGFNTHLISGPTRLNDPQGVTMTRIETAKEMLHATEQSLPADIMIACAAVADWAPIASPQKLKKGSGEPHIKLTENPDILKTIANHKNRPRLVIGFAAETENLLDNARAKRERKNCDAILANDVSNNVFGSDENHVYLITKSESQNWQQVSKDTVAEKLVAYIKEHAQCQK